MKEILMKMSMKIVAAALALAAAANGAYAGMTVSAQGNTGTNGAGSELLFWVYNIETSQSYVRDLGVRVTNFAPNSTSVPTDGTTYDFATAAPVGGNSFPAGYSSTPPGVNTPGYDVHWTDQSLVSFFGQSSFDSANTTWGIFAASATSGGARSLVSSIDTGVLTNAQNSDGQTIKTGVDTFIGSFNGCGATCGIQADVLTNQKGTSTDLSQPWNIGNISVPGLNFTYGANVGTSQSFYSISNTASGGTNSAYAGLWSLNSAGVLTYEVAAVPEPSTWAMLGAGLLVVGAIARRRVI
jgi:hypothetical protein